ncbi:retrotransposon protein, putative, ty1-copia subclass [Tanacetum coccineum]|uniref:Retrotransposon protein, putative, ty1-copia subclass n=1 Tax=Tanacetum coccineum TaxID=301880 RepID=A0ABQ4XNS7_9ASTR
MSILQQVGHWRRNCPVYLAELLKKKKLSQGASTSGIFTIELYSFPSTSWVYDTGCGTHICITTQGLRGSRKLKPGALSLYVGDGHRATVEAIGEFHLCLPSGLVLILHNCHYAPFITRGIISVSRLYKDGFVNRFENDNTISVSRNNLVYFSAIPRDDIYEINLSSSNTNNNSMYAVSNKRAKLNLDSTLLWHYHLGHISKKCIKKLQHDRLLDSTDIKTVSRQGASYFVTFTDDFSRYGYVYLLKHKHEVFETFKVFQKEVENQLGKTIKSLRSYRKGKYISQEFLYHLKEHGIIAHRTPPYTPQHNSVSKRINRTSVDMVRPMIKSNYSPRAYLEIMPLSLLHAFSTWFQLRMLNRHHTKINSKRNDGIYSFYYPTLEEEENKRDLGEPANYKAALLYPESNKWLNAINVEMQSMRDNKSQTGYLFILNGGAVDWKSTKQSIFATSSTDAEYIAAFDASKEAVWIRKFISWLAIAKDHGITKGARHFRAKVYYLRETIEMGDVRIEKVDTYDNLADPFKKALAFPKHSELTKKIGMMPASSLM